MDKPMPEIMRWLEPNPNLPDELLWIPQHIHKLAQVMVDQIDDDMELRTGLRKLLEAKDCFVRAHIAGG